MPSETGTITTSTIDIVPVQKAFSLFTRRSSPTDHPRIQAKSPLPGTASYISRTGRNLRVREGLPTVRHVLARPDRPARVGLAAALRAGGLTRRDQLVLASIVEAYSSLV